MYKKLSADPVALILGIVSLVIVFLGCCCGIFVLASFGLSIAGIVIANKGLREYNNAPEEYSYNSKNNVFIGKILNIIALVLSSLFLLILIAYFTIMGTLLTGSVLSEKWLNEKYQSKDQDTIPSVYIDSISEGDEKYIDSLEVEFENK